MSRAQDGTNRAPCRSSLPKVGRSPPSQLARSAGLRKYFDCPGGGRRGLYWTAKSKGERTNLQDHRALSASPQLFSRQWLGRLLLSVLLLIFWALSVFGSSNRLPFDARCTLTVCDLAPRPGTHSTVPVRSGDRAFLSEQSFVGRLLLIDGNVPRQHDYQVWLRRGATRLQINIRSVRAHREGQFAEQALATFVLLFALLMLWRGETAASRGLCIFATCNVLTKGLLVIALPPPWNLASINLGTLIGGPGPFIGLYLTANALVHPGRGKRSLSLAFVGYLAALAFMYVGETIPQLQILGGWNSALWWDLSQTTPLLFAAIAWALPLFYLVNGYRRSGAENRLRIRWFIASVSLLLPLLGLNIILGSERGFSATTLYVLQTFRILVDVSMFAMLSYAALSQRLVAVRFVMNRALVFALLTALLVGTLSLVESLIERSIISKDAGLALNLAVPLLLGLFINRIHRWGEESVERLVFRAEYSSRSKILTFLRDAGFISQTTTLYNRTAEIFADHAGGRYAGLYLASEGGYERAAASEKARDLPARLEVDDEAMVRLRATLAPLDLATVSSALGGSGLALPLAVRGRLEGLLVCGPKAEGRYAQAEIDFLEKAASGIAACIIALRAELHGYFVTQVAEGAVPSDRIIDEARRLAEA